MKRLASTLLVLVLFLTVGTTKGWSQRSGSLQATAQVVDTRAAMSGLESAQDLAAAWAVNPTHVTSIATQYAQVSLTSDLPSGDARPEPRLQVRVDFLRN